VINTSIGTTRARVDDAAQLPSAREAILAEERKIVERGHVEAVADVEIVAAVIGVEVIRIAGSIGSLDPPEVPMLCAQVYAIPSESRSYSGGFKVICMAL
jgi:hypothetical protein